MRLLRLRLPTPTNLEQMLSELDVESVLEQQDVEDMNKDTRRRTEVIRKLTPKLQYLARESRKKDTGAIGSGGDRIDEYWRVNAWGTRYGRSMALYGRAIAAEILLKLVRKRAMLEAREVECPYPELLK
eukprot:6492511-Amphidinium_carterae.1